MNRILKCSLVLVPAFAVAAVGVGSAQAAETAPARPPSIQTRVVTPDAVISAVLSQNPVLRGSRLARDQARQQVRAEEGNFPYVFQLDGGYTRSTTPSLGTGTSVVTSTRATTSVGSELRRTFPTGTSATVRLQGDRFRSTRPGYVPSYGDASGLGYQATARASVVQPLLKGAGRRVNEASLRVARVQESVAGRSEERQTSSLIRDALSSYWELWYATRATDIEKAALELAKQQAREAVARMKQGALAPVDALPFETRVASLTEQVVSAEANERQRALDLGQLVGQPNPAVMLRAAEAPPEASRSISRADALKVVTAASPEIAELEQRVRLARERWTTAGESSRARLDLEGYVEASGLGNGRVRPALEQVAGLDAMSVHVGVVYETPLDAQRYDAERAQARLDIQIAENDLETARQQLETQFSSLWTQADAATRRVEAAQKTVGISERQFQLERQRFELGSSTPIQVQEAEDSLRQARLRVARAQVDRVQALIAIEDATGALLRRYGRLAAR